MNLQVQQGVNMAVLAIDPGAKHLGVCLVSVDEEGNKEVVAWDCVDLTKKKKHKTIADVCGSSVDWITDEFVPKYGVPAVVRIESQPNQNIKMKVLSHVLDAVFRALGSSSVTLVNPKTYKTKGLTYAKRKADSITRVRNRLEEQSRWSVAFETAEKKDDLADSFLLAFWEND